MNRFILNKQNDKTDCGPACISSIAKFYGKDVSIAKIRQIAKTDSFGTSGRGMIKALNYLGFETKGVRIRDLNNINKYPLPMIGHINSNENYEHYIIIYKVKKNNVIVGDPLKGVYKISLEELKVLLSGVCLLVNPTERLEEVEESMSSIRVFTPFLISQKKIILTIILLSIISTILGIYSSFFIKEIVDKIIVIKDLSLLLKIGILFLLVNCLMPCIDYIRQSYILDLTKKVDVKIMSTIYMRLVKLPIEYFQNRYIGDITSRTDDAAYTRELLTNTFLSIIVDGFMAIGGGIILLSIDRYLFLFTMIPILLYSLTIYTFNNYIKENTKTLLEKSNKVKAKFIESINSIEVIKYFTLERVKSSELSKNQSDLANLALIVGKKISMQLTLQQAIRSIFNVIVLWGGAYLVIQNKITLGYLLTFTTLQNYFLTPIERLIQNQYKIQNARSASTRLMDILDTDVEEDFKSDISDGIFSDNICFRDVNFRYGERNLILNKINIDIFGNEKIGIVGESGSGKTTIANILIGNYEIEDGDIYFGSTNIRDIPLEQLRVNIGYISQNIVLFSGTFMENFLSNDIYLIKHYCKCLDIHDFIESLPKGYYTQIEEGGKNLSGGQRQKISIIRALLKSPKILIFDEATSNLDTISEKKMNKLIDDIGNITVLKIAHRLTTIKDCEKIYVLDKGCVVESGSHNELLLNNGKYSCLWNADLVESEETVI